MDKERLTEAVTESITELEEVYSEDPVIKKFLPSDVDISKLLGITEHLIFKMLLGEEDTESATIELASEYIEKGLGYIALINCIDKLKNRVLFRLSEDPIDVQEQIRQLFEDIKNHVAKAFILKDLNELSIGDPGLSLRDPLYNHMVEWFFEFRELILSGDYDKALSFSTKKCKFEDIIEKISYRIRCTNYLLCESLKRAHRNLHNTAKDFAYLMSIKDYSTAHFMFSDIKEKLNNFIMILEKLNVIFRDDGENIFFKFVSEEAASPGEKTLLILGLKNLLILSSIFSKNELNELFERIAGLIEEIARDRDIGYVKGAGGDFFILALESSKKIVPILKQKLETFIVSECNHCKKAKPQFVIAGFRLEPYTQISEEEARKALYHLKLEAIQKGFSEYLLDKKGRISLIEEINKKYRNIKLLTQVLKEGKVDVHFQPIFDCKDSSCNFYCMETLARVVIKEKTISAGIFIDLIHEMELIERLDSLVLEKLSHYCNHIPKITQRISINVSPRSLKSHNFREKLKETCFLLTSQGITPVIELTEQSFMDNISVVEELSGACSVKFGVDDFGTGYSSLKIVVDLAEKGLLEMLKLDGSLVKQLMESEKAEKIVKILLNISQELNVACVAEFVESEELFHKLLDLGVRYLQGYYLGMPEHLTSILAKYM